MITLDYNILSKATTQYDNFNFNSMTEFNGSFIGSNESGIFEIGGDTDNGLNIPAYFELKNNDFGIQNRKRLRYIYIGLEASGDLEVTITVDERMTKVLNIPITVSGQQRVSVAVPRSLFGRYWSIKISNVSGSDFSIDYIQVLPIIMGNSITGR